MKKRKSASRKPKALPSFPAPAGAPKKTFKVDPDDEMIQIHNAARADPLTEKAASIIMPLLKAKKVTPKMIQVMLDEILRVRGRLNALDELAKQAQELKMGYGANDPVPVLGKLRPKTCGELAALLPILTQVPAEESVRFERDLKAAKNSQRSRKRVLLPEFKKLMSKKTVDSTQDDLDEVRGDR